jgi:uncharacterized protein (DUF2235 family)
MPKNIVVCLDGTGNEVKAKAVTNVFKMSELIDLSDPASQVLYYSPGVGTLPAPGAWTGFSRRSPRMSAVWGSAMACVTTSSRRTATS